MGLTIKRNNDLEKMLGSFTTKKVETDKEKKDRNKFLAKDDKKKK